MYAGLAIAVVVGLALVLVLGRALRLSYLRKQQARAAMSPLSPRDAGMGRGAPVESEAEPDFSGFCEYNEIRWPR